MRGRRKVRVSEMLGDPRLARVHTKVTEKWVHDCDSRGCLDLNKL